VFNPHRNDRELWSYLVATAFHVPHSPHRNIILTDLRVLPKTAAHFGDCSENGLIRLRLRRASGRRLEPYNILDTLAHELAHLSFWEHTDLWFREHLRIQSHFLNRGIYADVCGLCR